MIDLLAAFLTWTFVSYLVAGTYLIRLMPVELKLVCLPGYLLHDIVFKRPEKLAKRAEEYSQKGESGE